MTIGHGFFATLAAVLLCDQCSASWVRRDASLLECGGANSRPFQKNDAATKQQDRSSNRLRFRPVGSLGWILSPQFQRLVGNKEEIAAIIGLFQFGAEVLELPSVDESHAIRDLFRATDAVTLPLLQGAHKIACLVE